MVVYKTTNLINGKIYVGQDSKNNPKYLGSGIALNNAIKKYGKENFKKEILENCSDKVEMDEKEKYWIEHLKARDKKIGYNITKGGEGCLGCSNKGIVFTKKHKENISINHHDVSGQNNPMFGKKHSEEVKLKISKANSGREINENTKNKMSETKKGEKNSNSKLTEKQVLLIREEYFKNNISQKDLSLKFGVEKACIHKIVTYLTWRHI
jgi:group I intron endonuclease